MRTGVLLGLILALLGDAAAQPVATSGRDRAPHPPSGLGGTLHAGAAAMLGRDAGWLGRLEYELFPVLAPSGIAGPLLGFHIGFQLWRAKPDWGFSVPLVIVFGVRAQPVRATIGVGVEAILVDVVDDDTGFGLYAPLAGARVGADVLGFQLGADARIVRRWQFGAPDHTQWQLGAFIGRTWESKDRRPRY